MIYYTCPISGQHLKFKQFNECRLTFAAIHPLLQVSIADLQKIALPKNKDELQLIVAAYVWQIRSISPHTQIFRFDGCVNLSERFLFQNVDFILRMLVRIAANINNSQYSFPAFVWTGETMDYNFWNWLKAVESIFESYEAFNSSETIESDGETDDGELQFLESITLKINRTRHRIKLIRASFANLEANKIDIISRILMKPNKYEYKTLRDVKILAQEYLLESPAENWIEKERIIRELDEIMLQKIDVAEYLLGNLDEEANDLRDDILSNYKIEIAGQTFMSSTISAALSQKPEEKLKPVTIPQEMPKRENYKNNFAFDMAMRLWKQNSNKQESTQ